MKKLKSIFTMVAFCATISLVSNLKDKSVNGDMMVGVTYAMAEAGESNEFIALVDAVGGLTSVALATGPVGWGFGAVAVL